MAKAKLAKPKLFPSAAALKKSEKIRNGILTKREALDKRETARMAHRQAAGRKNVHMELQNIQGKLAMLRPGVAGDVVRTLQARQSELLKL